MIGRSEELHRLRRLLERAADGTPGTLLVRGEVGVGKSRLLTEFAGVATSGARVLSGGCIALGVGEIPYAPVVEALRRLVRELGQGRLRELAGSAWPDVAGLMSDSVDDVPQAAGPTQSPQSRVFGAILRLLDQLGNDEPVVLIIEDLQWADPSTLDLFGYLARQLSGERLLLVGSYRTTDLDPLHPLRMLVAELDVARRIDQLKLMPFGRTELRAFLRELLGQDASHAQVEHVFDLSEGNAFFVEELLAADVLKGDDRPLTLPRSVQALVSSRLGQLGADAQDVIRVAGTAGRRVSHRLLAAVCDMSDRRLDAALRECVDAQMLVIDHADGTYLFRHPLVREVVLQGLLPGQRTALHGLIAKALAADSRLSLAHRLTAAAELSYHWHGAGAFPEALAAAVRAGDEAVRLRAFREAERLYLRALEVWPHVDDSVGTAGLPKARLLISAADAARWAGREDRAVELARQAVAEVDSRADPALAAEMNERLGSHLWELGDHPASERAYAEAGLLSRGAPPSAVAARVKAVEASAKIRAGHYADGLELGRSALAMAESVGARAEQGRALGWIGVALTLRGNADDGVAALRDAAAIAESEGLLEDLFRALANLAYMLETAGRLDESVLVALDGLDRIRLTGLEHTRSGALLANNACAAMLQLGRWNEAADIITRLLPGRQLAESLFPRLTLAEIEVARGRFDVARRLLAEIGDAGESVGQPQFIASIHACSAEMAVWEHRHTDARVAVTDGLQAIAGAEHPIARLRLCALGLRNEADIRSGEPTALSTVRELVAEVDRIAGPGGHPVLPDVAALVKLCRAERSRVDGDRADQPAVWREVAETWEALGRPYPAALARWREAEAAWPDQIELGRSAVLQAYQSAAMLGARPLHSAVLELVHGAGWVIKADGADPALGPTATVQPPDEEYRLTPRERQVLALLCAGRTNRQIGKELGIKEKTASVHVTNVMGKLKVPSRAAAAVKATRSRLVPEA